MKPLSLFALLSSLAINQALEPLPKQTKQKIQAAQVELAPWANCGKLDDEGKVIAYFYDDDVDDVIECSEIF